MSRSLEAEPVKKVSRKEVILNLAGAATFIACAAWGVNQYANVSGPLYTQQRNIFRQQDKLSKELHESGTVVDYISAPLGMPAMEQKIINPDDPKLKEYTVLENEANDLSRKIHQQEGPILWRARLFSIILGSLGAAGFLSRLAGNVDSKRKEKTS